MRPLTVNDIRSSFVNAAPAEVEQAPIPGLHDVLWEEREFLGWRDAHAIRRGYIVHWMEGRPVGIIVRAATGRPRTNIAAMCSLCHSRQPATQVRLFSAPRAGEAGHRGDTVGSYICEDLACSLLIRHAASPHDAPDAVAGRGAELLRRVHGFTRSVLHAA